MSTDLPQEQYDERDHPERVRDDRDRATALDRDHTEPVEDEGDRGAAQERDHPERVGDERDGAAAQEADRPTATATALPEGEGAGPGSAAGAALTVVEDRDTGARPTPRGMPTSAQADFKLFGPGELEGYHSRWESIQLGFLDDPKGAAEQADTVVGELLGRLTERRQALSDELNRQSDQDVDTESMRLAVRNYRSLFRRLVGS